MTQTTRIVGTGLATIGLMVAGVGIGGSFLGWLSVISIVLAVSVIVYKNPVISILWLIGLFFTIAIYLIIIGMDFIGISYLLVYVGAVSILFLFILMLINIRISELLSDTKNSILLLILIVLLFSVTFIDMVPSQYANLFYSNSEMIFISSSNCWEDGLAAINNIVSLGYVMYTNYSILLILVSSILLVAMVGAIIITIKPKDLYSNVNEIRFLPVKSEIVLIDLMIDIVSRIDIGNVACKTTEYALIGAQKMLPSPGSVLESFLRSPIAPKIMDYFINGMETKDLVSEVKPNTISNTSEIDLAGQLLDKINKVNKELSHDQSNISNWSLHQDIIVYLINSPNPMSVSLEMSAERLLLILSDHYTIVPSIETLQEFLRNPIIEYFNTSQQGLGTFGPDDITALRAWIIQHENDVINPLRRLLDNISNNTLPETITISGRLTNDLAQLVLSNGDQDAANRIIYEVYTGTSLLNLETVQFSTEFLRNILENVELDFNKWEWYKIITFFKLKVELVDTHCG